MKFLAFLTLVVAVISLGQAQTFRRVPSADGNVQWELTLDGENVHGPKNIPKVAASGLGQGIRKSYSPNLVEKTVGTSVTPSKKVYSQVTKGPLYKTHYQPTYQPGYRRGVQQHPVYRHPPVSPNAATTFYKTEGIVPRKEHNANPRVRVHNVGSVYAAGGSTPDYSYGVPTRRYY